MPVIVYKTLSLQVAWAQIRRIRCGECRATFAYVVGGKVTSGSTGLPLVSSDDAMRRSAGRGIDAKLNRIARAKRRGVARCAACGRPQSWMLTNWFVEHTPIILMSLVLLAPIPAIAGFAFTGSSNVYLTFSWVSFTVASVLVLAAIAALGWFLVQRALGPEDGPNPRAMSDGDLRAFLADCAARDVDPALTWWWGRVRKKQPSDDLGLASLPFLDAAGGFRPDEPPPIPGR